MAFCVKATQPEGQKSYVGSHGRPDQDVDTHSQNHNTLIRAKGFA